VKNGGNAMTGEEWEAKFRAENGRLPKREEYRTASENNFEPVAPVVTVPSKNSNKKPWLIAGAVVVMMLLGGGAYAIFSPSDQSTSAPTKSAIEKSTSTEMTQSKTSKELAAKQASSAKAASSRAASVSRHDAAVASSQSAASSAAIAASESASASASSSATATSVSQTPTSTPGVAATDLNRADRATILAQVIAKQAKLPAVAIKGIESGIVGGVGSGKGSLHLDTGVNGLQATYTVSGADGVGTVTGTYSQGNGDTVHNFSVNINDWLAHNNLDDAKKTYGDVTLQ